MKKLNEEKARKISRLSALAALVISILLEFASRFLPQFSKAPTSTEYTLTIFRNIFILILAVSFTVFLFLFLKKRLGVMKAAFYTVFADSLILFICGFVLMAFTQSITPSQSGMGSFESLYLYLLGLMTTVISAGIFVLAVIIFVFLRITLYIIGKKHHTLK